MVNREVAASKLANCVDNLRILNVSSRRQVRKVYENINFDAEDADKMFDQTANEDDGAEELDIIEEDEYDSLNLEE